MTEERLALAELLEKAGEVVDAALGVSVDRLRRAGFGSGHLGPVALA